MKHLLLSLIVAVLTLGTVIPEAEARRLGGGGSFGMQRQATPAPAPRQPATQPAARPAQQPATAGNRSWMGPVAGLAAGLGLAALFAHLGLGEEFGSLLLLALFIFGAVMLFRMLSRRAQGAQGVQRMQYATATASSGNGATSQRTAFDTTPVSHVSSPVASAHPDFDAEGFARQAKLNFIRLQAAHDEANLDDIRQFTTPEMFAEIRLQLTEHHRPGQRTDVVDLNADVIEVVEEDDRYIVSVRFNGLIREDRDTTPAVFDEVWHLTKSRKDDRGWLIAGIQQIA
ncbi:Tim44 domain-containing protein [Rhodocyclaceae bacterium SMB388]